MPKPNPTSKSWLGVAFGVAGRFSRRMRDEWKAGKAEAGHPLGTDGDKKSVPMSRQVPVVEKWWEVLHVSASASQDEIRRAWRGLMKKNHPDKGGHLSPEAQAAMDQMTKLLNDAYERAMKKR